ncbi:MAG TPA: hypothetical protein VEW71_06855 [Allosphingosinicella sp.]|nr:hypothetical protein [Allosphingosinicella sp.]
MGKRIVNMRTERVADFCKKQLRDGASKCEGTAKGDGTSDVLVEFPPPPKK